MQRTLAVVPHPPEVVMGLCSGLSDGGGGGGGGLKPERRSEGVVVSTPTLIINYHYHKASLFLSGLDEIPAVRWSLTDQMLTAAAPLMPRLHV